MESTEAFQMQNNMQKDEMVPNTGVYHQEHPNNMTGQANNIIGQPSSMAGQPDNTVGQLKEERESQPGSSDMAGNDQQHEMVEIPDYSEDYGPNAEVVPTRTRSTWPERRILGLLDIYIKEHPVYLKAKMERQITEFHEYIGQILNTDGMLVAGLLKNLSREYRKVIHVANSCGRSPSTCKLRGSKELFQKFEEYYQVYNKLSANDWAAKSLSRFSKPKVPKRSASLPAKSSVIPKIKKLKKIPKQTPPMHSSFDAMMNPTEVKIPPVAVMSDKYCQEYIEVMREQNQALIEIGKEIRLMRMGYFTEHELALD